MNNKLIFTIMGMLLYIEAAFLVPAVLVALIYHENCIWSFLITIAICLAAGFILRRFKPDNTVFSLREGYVTVAMGWLIISLFGSIPFIISGSIPGIVNCLFETVSGFTTTGSTILEDVDAMPHAMNFWRCMTHWMGGMGILVFLMAIMPMLGGSSMNLMKAESSGPSVSRLMPTAKKSAQLLYKIYIALTLSEIILLLLTRMNLFDAVTISLSTAGTGGFAPRGASCADYTTVQQIIITGAMLMFGINFTAFFFLIRRKFKEALRIEEVRGFLLAYAVIVLVITWSIKDRFDSFAEALQQSAFQTASIITSTGFSTMDYVTWPMIACILLTGCMFVGSASGSTGGGIKFCRILILAKSIKRELLSYAYPNAIAQVRLDGKRVDESVIRSVHVYIAAYAMIFASSLLIISLDGFDFQTSFTAVLSSLCNIGLGFGKVGPSGSFDIFSNLSKCVLSFDMLAGRLEIFPILMILMPRTWRKF